MGDGKIMNLTWDAENRLIVIEPAVPVSGDKKVENVYDGQSRRVRKTVSTYNGGWSVTKDEKFLYDNWNLAVTFNVLNSSFVRLDTFTWGLDLSGSLQGAGGVGGLLSSVSIPTSAFSNFSYDANGNVSEVLDNSGSVVAHYEYDPFGNTNVATGGYRRITALLRRDGWKINAKRVQRVRRQEGLKVSKRQRKMRRVGQSTALRLQAMRANHVWSWDFVEDQTEAGS
ncbi:MAG: IS3 family transposase, partial [Methylacidiphilales bacterium]|nr:IS3 family transposase [Candidatus Methylacidiphilales bacterium]